MTRLAVCLLVALLAAIPASAGDVSATLDSGAGFVVKNSTGAIERLRVDEATGNISRNGALFVHTTGNSNLFVGPGAGNTSTTGTGYNTAFGQNVLGANTTGYTNSGVGTGALSSNTTGSSNSAFGISSLRFNTTGFRNSAVGHNALRLNTIGYGNSAVGFQALFNNTTGTFNSAVGYLALRNNSTACCNSAFGSGALKANTTGIYNSAFGTDALVNNTTGGNNSAFGLGSLRYNTTGMHNSALGRDSLVNNTTGSSNSAFGSYALRNDSTGGSNAAFGKDALLNDTSGARNVAVGVGAGNAQTTGNDNIYLANSGVAGESGQIRIGTSGTHTTTFVAGILDTTLPAGSASVLVGTGGRLGVLTSSARFKQDVRDMGDASDVLMKLRPVTFRYREEVVGAEDAQRSQYGMIAEEVAGVAPELVTLDEDGKPYTVMYHELPALLVNEAQKDHRAISELERTKAEQQRKIEQDESVIAEQRRELAALTARLARLESAARATATR